MSDLAPDDPCPNCNHAMNEHIALESGCTHGWTYGPDGGPSLTDGCFCPLAIAVQA